MMKRAGHASIVIMLIALALSHTRAHAWGWLSLYPIEIEAVLRFDGTDRQSNNNYDTRDTEWQAGVRINQQGYILDPGIASFQLGVEPVYIWGKFDSTIDPQTHSGDILSYLVQLNLLQGTPGPLGYRLGSMRTRNLNSGSLGGRYLTEFQSNTASMQWKNLAFPMSLQYEERSLMQDFVSGQSSSTVQRNELVKTLTAKGRSSKMEVLAEYQSVDDRVSERDLDFEVKRADLTHRLPWGSNSLLRSRLDYYDRTGFNAYERLGIEENARIQHTGNVFSQSYYRFQQITQLVKSTEHNGQFEIYHQLYNNLTTSAHAFGSSITSDPVDLTLWRAGVEGQYYKQDLFGAAFNVGLAFSYQMTDRDSRLGLVTVNDESHVVTLGGAIVLTRRFIITATIIVTSADSTLVYADGIDYVILDIGDDLTQLQVIPGGRIETGDTLLVSYKAQALPSQEFSTTFTKFNLGLDLGWVRFSHYDRKSDDDLISGAGESFLNPYRDIVTDLEFNWMMGPVEAFVGAERRFSRYSSFETTSYTYRQLLTWGSSRGTQWNLSALESFTEATNLDTDLYNIELVINWQPMMNLSVRPKVGAWRRYDRGATVSGGEREDQFITAGFTLRWFYRKVAFDMAYNYNQRATDLPLTSGLTKTDEHRLMFNLTRKF